VAPRRHSKRDDGGREGSGRRRRYAKSTNWTGIVVFFVVLGSLGVTAMVLADKFGQAKDQDGNEGSERREAAADPAGESRRGDRASREVVDQDPGVVAPDRPAPEFKSESVQRADALFRAAKKLYAEAEIAEDAGKNSEFLALMGDCRDKFTELHAYLRVYTTWLADAKAGDWEIPQAYATLEKRTTRFAKFEARVPDKAP
jgi:hypothetical protein